MPDLSKLSDAELETIASGDLSSLPDSTLSYLSGEQVASNDIQKDSITKPKRKSVVENLLSPETEPIGGARQRVFRMAQSPLTPQMDIGSLILSGAGVPEENVMPGLLGTVGGIAGGRIGHPNLGAGVGTAVGDLIKQSAKKLRGSGDDISVQDAIILGGAVSAGGKAIETVAKTVGLSMNIIPERARAKFFNKALQAVNVGKKTLTREWGRAVNALVEAHPNQRINLSSQMKAISENIAGLDESIIPQLKTALRKNPKLAKAVSDPNEAVNLTLTEAQNLKNAIKESLNTVIKKSVKGQTTPNERMVFDLLDDIDWQTTKQFPEMITIRQAYSEGRKAFDMARPLVEPGKAVEASIFSKPGGLFATESSSLFGSTQGKLAAQDIMSKTPAGAKMFEAAKLAHRINAIADFVGRVGKITAVSLTGKKLLELK